MEELSDVDREPLVLGLSKSLTKGERLRLKIEARKDNKMARLGRGRRNEK